MYDSHMQCALMHGPGYLQITPRQDHFDGICYMMWCGQGQFGRIITSHPALEGTFCGPNKWCQLGRCVPWTGGGAPMPVTVAPALIAQPSVGYNQYNRANKRKILPKDFLKRLSNKELRDLAYARANNLAQSRPQRPFFPLSP